MQEKGEAVGSEVMDRFTWHQVGTAVNEEIKVQAPGVCLYDGEEKVSGLGNETKVPNEHKYKPSRIIGVSIVRV